MQVLLLSSMAKPDPFKLSLNGVSSINLLKTGHVKKSSVFKPECFIIIIMCSLNQDCGDDWSVCCL